MSAAPGRGKRTTPLTPKQRIEIFHKRLGIDEEELLRRQAHGLRIREHLVRRAFQRAPISRFRALVVVNSNGSES